jgi:glycosyltransferase involved in cell wall biosynthesis
MIVKKIKKIIFTIIRVADYAIFVLVFPFCLVGLLFAIPWILKQRRVWKISAKGNKKALIIQPFSLEKVMGQGYELILPFRNTSLKWIGYLDPVNLTDETKIDFSNDFSLMAWKMPKIISLMEKKGFCAISILFREIIAIFRVTNYCVKQRIGVLRAYRHNYPALRALLISRFIKIPYIVDISGNYELIYRFTGKTAYFRKLKVVPIIRRFLPIAVNWLVGWPLRHAFHVFGRNKNNYEHAFALGAPVERLSLLRYNNFDAAFNSYDPEQPPAKPANYPYILFVGRLAQNKFPLDVIDVFDMAAPQLPEHRLVMIGDGAIRRDVEFRIEGSEHNDRIVLLGACSSDVVLKWTAHARVNLCPFSGSALAEALLCGNPVIAYDIEWHSDLIFDDYTGFLVPFADKEAMAQKLVKLVYVVHNYEEAKKVGMRGRDLARVAFDKEKILAKETIYYMKALEQ